MPLALEPPPNPVMYVFAKKVVEPFTKTSIEVLAVAPERPVNVHAPPEDVVVEVVALPSTLR
jgi:hypothetical protein